MAWCLALDGDRHAFLFTSRSVGGSTFQWRVITIGGARCIPILAGKFPETEENMADIEALTAAVAACGLAVREASAANDADAVKKAQGKMDAAKMALKKAQKAAKASKKKDQPKKQKAGGKKKVSGLGLEAKKSENFALWYSSVIVKAEMIEYYEDVSGCYILRPWAYNIWEAVKTFFDGEIKDLGVENSYFPMFVSKKALTAEEDHVDGFAAEVAWVTKSGSSDLAEPIAIRPTSETIMYPAFAKWIHSHRDLPLQLNQWTNVVRWEFKNPTPFIRTREFLWQEGHSAFETQEEADAEVLSILDLYARVYEELMAVPVIKGRKSEKERFPGGFYTTTVEAFIPAVGRSVQGATSHCLGQNFGKIFNISYETKNGKDKAIPIQNSWGLTTRSIGVMTMVHGDDKGLVLPPRVAPLQVAIVWLYKAEDDKAQIDAIADMANDLGNTLKAAGLRVKVDNRMDKTGGWKRNYWEQKGVPVRIDIGSAELTSKEIVMCRRDTLSQVKCHIDATVDVVKSLMVSIQEDMLDKARRERDARLSIVTTWDEFMTALESGNMILAPWCELMSSEIWVKKTTKEFFLKKEAEQLASKGEEAQEDDGRSLTGAAKTLCIPFAQPPMAEGQLCFTSVEGSPGLGKKATAWTLWGRSY